MSAEDQPDGEPEAAAEHLDRSFLLSVLDSVADPIFVKDEGHRWVALNVAMGELFGRERDELLGKSDFDFFPEDEAREFWEKDQLVFDSGEVNVNVEPFTDAQGVTHIISTKKRRFTDAAGRPHLVGVIRDITEQKRTEEALVRARDAAEAGARAKAAFLANVSHELRTPLNAVLGMTTLLLDTRLNDDQREYARIIRESSDDLLTLINDLLDLVKAEQDKLTLERAPFDVALCARRALALVEARAGEKGLALSLHIDDDVPAAVEGDITRVRQVLVNLLTNAVKFTDEGSVSLLVQPTSDGLSFEVRDTGVGIPKGGMAELFEPFIQLDASTTRRFGGTGLGLAIARRFAEAMGGALTAESVVGEGSVFRFQLPAEPAPRPAAVPAGEAGRIEALGDTHPLRVLVAEDNHVNQKVARLILRRLGYEADVAASGREVVDALARRPYDVVLMDLQMPDVDGLEATRRLRTALPADRQPWVVALTASVTPRDVQRCLEAGMDAHLPKPVRIADLHAVLARAPRLGERS